MEDKLLYLSQEYSLVDNILTIDKSLLPAVWSPSVRNILKYIGMSNVESVVNEETEVVITLII